MIFLFIFFTIKILRVFETAFFVDNSAWMLTEIRGVNRLKNGGVKSVIMGCKIKFA